MKVLSILLLGGSACSGTANVAAPGNTPPPDDTIPSTKLIAISATKLAVGVDHLLEVTDETVAMVRRVDRSIVWEVRGLDAITANETPYDFSECEQFTIHIAPVERSDRPIARIGLVCKNGEDSFTASEFVLLLDVSEVTRKPYPPLWLAPGNHHTTDYAQGEACLTWKTVVYDVRGATIRETITEEQRAPEGAAGCEAKTSTSSSTSSPRR